MTTAARIPFPVRGNNIPTAIPCSEQEAIKQRISYILLRDNYYIKLMKIQKIIIKNQFTLITFSAEMVVVVDVEDSAGAAVLVSDAELLQLTEP